MENQKIYDLELHATHHEDDGNIDITRVPGGWLYRYAMLGMCTFVPHSDEFDPIKIEYDRTYQTRVRQEQMRNMQAQAMSSIAQSATLTSTTSTWGNILK